MDKALTFEEWRKEYNTRYKGILNEDMALMVWDAARIGMIPADRAVEIPDVSEWPEWAKTVCLFYSEYVDKYGGYICRDGDIITRITIPVPAWVPKVGDRVFALVVRIDEGKEKRFVGIDEIASFDASVYPVMKSNGYAADPKFIKPFSPEKIGLPWEEI